MKCLTGILNLPNISVWRPNKNKVQNEIDSYAIFSHNLKKVPIFYVFIKILSLKKTK